MPETRPSTLSLMETRPSALSLHVLVRITPSASVVAQHRWVTRQRRRPWRTSTRAGPRPPRRPSPPPRECSGRPNNNSCVTSCVASSRARQISIPYHPPTNLAFVPFVLLRRPPRIFHLAAARAMADLRRIPHPCVLDLGQVVRTHRTPIKSHLPTRESMPP